MMTSKYDRIIGSFLRKAAKLDKLAAANERKITAVLAKIDAYREKMERKLTKYRDKDLFLSEEKAKAEKTAENLKKLLGEE
jgi:hypothetical protein